MKKRLPPDKPSIAQLVKDEGISEATLYNWRMQARNQGRLLPDADTTPEGWSSKDKFAAVLERALVSQAEVAKYCRKHGFYPEQLSQWRQACEQANDVADMRKREQKETTRSLAARP